jgi:putative MATE family efflux protein
MQRIVSYYRDRAYFDQLLQLGVPIALQSFAMNALSMIGSVMIGQKGTVAVAAVGLANQMFFLLMLVIFGITSGTAIFTAQLWGKQDIPNIRKVLGLTLQMSLLAGIVFTVLAEFFPRLVMSYYTADQEVIALSSLYLRTYGWSFLFYAVTTSYSMVHRSIGNVRLPLFVTSFSLCFNTFLSYLLIFGKLGFPEMGVQGAALAVLTSRIFECVILLVATYQKGAPLAAGLNELFRVDPHFSILVLKPVLPIAFNELLWSTGVTTVYAIYARVGTEAIATMNIISSIDTLFYVVFRGISHATAIMVGNRIGAGKEKDAYTYAGRSLGLEALSGVFVGAAVLVCSGPILSLYKVSPSVIENARRVLIILSSALWLRAMNSAIVVGILRGGGDTRFCLSIDGTMTWLVAVPMASLGAFIFHLPVYWVYCMALAEEVCKFGLGMYRFLSHKWIHNLAQTISDSPEIFPEISL